MKKLESNQINSLLNQPKMVSIETITQSFNVIRIYLTDDGVNGTSSHLDQLEAILDATENDVVEVYCLACPGGSIDTIASLLNALANTSAHTVTIVEGHNASAGTMCAMVTDEVRLGMYASFMLHSASGGIVGNMTNTAEAAKFYEQHYNKFLKDVYYGFITAEEEILLQNGREIYMNAEQIRERLDRRQRIIQEECENSNEEACVPCDETCSNIDNPCKECLELPEIKLEEENIPPVKKSSPSKKSSTKKAKALVVGSGKSPVVSLQQKERFNKLAKNPKLTEGRSFPEVDLP